MIYKFADCAFDTQRLTLERNDRVVPLEPKVFDLIHLLLRNAGNVVTKDEIVEEIWDGRVISESAISARISNARKALGDSGKQQKIIRTVARRGLEFIAEVAIEGEKPARTSGNSNHAASAEQIRVRFTHNRNGKAVAFAVAGAGKPVVHVGPAMMTDVEVMWREPTIRALFDVLCEQHQLLRHDHVGSGQSDREADSFDFWDHAEDLKQVLEAAGWEKTAMMAISGGAHTVLRFAARYPERVSRLIIVGGYVSGRALRSDAPDPMKALLEAGGAGESMSLTEAFMLLYWPEGPMEALRERARLVRSVAPEKNTLRVRDAFDNVSNAGILKDIRCPTLIIHGRHDGVHPLSEARTLAAGIPDAELVILETANHWPLPGNTVWEEYLSTVLQFLDR
ncbi:MAG: alpha/beta fold hydrolase [Paracoccaceae bacterium]|nr:alpha/beta fold hydrolase [Paracoccaceae bacterium]